MTATTSRIRVSSLPRGRRRLRLLSLTGISATLGLALVASVGASRILFSMGRAGTAHPRFAALHPKFQVPWNSLHVIFIAGLVGGLVLFACNGAYNAYVW